MDLLDPRVTLALERTMLAWTRTAIALMGFGFIVARLTLLLRELGGPVLTPPAAGAARWMGVSMVALGAVTQAFALVEYGLRVRRLRRGENIPLRVVSLATVLGAALLLIGIVVAMYLVSLT